MTAEAAPTRRTPQRAVPFWVLAVAVLFLVGLAIFSKCKSEAKETQQGEDMVLSVESPTLIETPDGWAFPGYAFAPVKEGGPNENLPLGLGLYMVPPGASPCFLMQEAKASCLGFDRDIRYRRPVFKVGCRSGNEEDEIVWTGQNADQGANSFRVYNPYDEPIGIWTRTDPVCPEY